MKLPRQLVLALALAGLIPIGVTVPAHAAEPTDCSFYAFAQAGPSVHLLTGNTTTVRIFVDAEKGCTQRGPMRVQLVPDREVVTRSVLVYYQETYPPDDPIIDRWSGTLTFQNNQSVSAYYEVRVQTIEVGTPNEGPPPFQIRPGALLLVRATSLRATALTARTLPASSRFRLSGRLGRYLGSAGNRAFPGGVVRLWAQRAGQPERVVDVATSRSDGTFVLDFPVRATETLSVRYQQVDQTVAGARISFGTVRVR